MAVQLYDAYVPFYHHALRTATHILKIGEEFAKEKGISESDVLGWRVYEDMLPLTFQVQTICNNIKNAIGRITQIEQPKVDDNEKTFEELYARIDSTKKILDSVEKKHFESRDSAEIVVKFSSFEQKFTGLSYMQNYSIPNLYFHLTTLYNILRGKGVKLGKMNFLRGGA